MKRMALSALLVLALVACKEESEPTADDAATGAATETTPAETAAPAENTSTADDGAGAMDGAPAEDTATADDGAGAMDGAAMAGSEVSQDAIDACIDELRAVQEGGGTILSTEFSEANSLVMLEDASGGTWRCLVSNDGTNPTLEAQGGASDAADDGAGAMDGAPAEDTATADDGAGAMDGAAMGGSEVSQEAIDACIDSLMALQGGGGTILSTEFSEANSLVMMQDGAGATWRCLVSNDGTGATVEPAN